MGLHNDIIGREYTREEVREFVTSNFMSIEQLAKLYRCTPSNVNQNILKLHRSTKKERFSKVDWANLFPSDLIHGEPQENEKQDKFILCNEKLSYLLMNRSLELDMNLTEEAEKHFKFI